MAGFSCELKSAFFHRLLFGLLMFQCRNNVRSISDRPPFAMPAATSAGGRRGRHARCPDVIGNPEADAVGIAGRPPLELMDA
jgi:hypothetical protein